MVNNMLVKKLKHTDYTMLSVPIESKAKVDKFCQDNGFTLRSVVETMIEVFLDAWPIASHLSYNKKKVYAKIDKRIGKLRKIPTLKDKRIKQSEANNVT